MKGVVSSVRRSLSSDNIYTIIGDSVVVASSDKVLNLYDSVEFQEEVRGDGSVHISVQDAAAGDAQACSNAISRFVSANLSKNLLKVGITQFDSVTEKMRKEMFSAAERVIRSLASGSPIVLRFHNDGDGSSGE